MVAVAAPIRFIPKSFFLVPFLHGTNKLIQWVSASEGAKPFIDNEAEHPHINYNKIPVKSLYELRRLIRSLKDFLPRVTVPSLILHADNDPVVASSSAGELINMLGSNNKQIKIINADRHGILMNNTGGIWSIIDTFLDDICSCVLP